LEEEIGENTIKRKKILTINDRRQYVVRKPILYSFGGAKGKVGGILLVFFLLGNMESMNW
jgi:hypothetical protein